MSARRMTRPMPSASLLVQGLGMGRAYRDFLGALSDADQRDPGAAAPKPFKATLQEPPIPGDSSATATEPALPAYVAYQGDGDVTAPARLRQLWNAGRLQDAPAAGRQRQGQDRHRPLWRRLARIETQTRAGARRGRLYHLFRPGG